MLELINKTVLVCGTPPDSFKKKNKVLAEIRKSKDKVREILNKIPETDHMSTVVNEVKSEIETFFESEISYLESLLDVL